LASSRDDKAPAGYGEKIAALPEKQQEKATDERRAALGVGLQGAHD
jgi:hypothetical protein